MSLKRRLLSTLTVVGIVGAFAVVSFAQDSTTTPAAPEKNAGKPFKGQFGAPGMGRVPGRGGFAGGMRARGPFFFLRGLGLTDAQKAQIRTIVQTNRPDPAIMQELRTIMQARRAGTITDAQKARAQEIRQHMQQLRRSTLQDIIGVLTPEQKAILEKRRQQQQQRMQQWKKALNPGTPDKPAPAPDKPTNN
jgi:Spy/CpxP family protein refolding chaperone